MYLIFGFRLRVLLGRAPEAKEGMARINELGGHVSPRRGCSERGSRAAFVCARPDRDHGRFDAGVSRGKHAAGAARCERQPVEPRYTQSDHQSVGHDDVSARPLVGSLQTGGDASRMGLLSIRLGHPSPTEVLGSVTPRAGSFAPSTACTRRPSWGTASQPVQILDRPHAISRELGSGISIERCASKSSCFPFERAWSAIRHRLTAAYIGGYREEPACAANFKGG